MLSESQSKEVSTAKKLQQVESELKSLKREITRKSSIELTSSRRSANIPNSNDTDGSVNYQVSKVDGRERRGTYKFCLISFHVSHPAHLIISVCEHT